MALRMTLTERRPVASNGQTIYGDDGRNRAKEEIGRALRRVDGERKPLARLTSGLAPWSTHSTSLTTQMKNQPSAGRAPPNLRRTL